MARHSFFKHIIDDVHNILQKDPAALHFWQVLLCYSGLHAIIWHRIAHPLHRRLPTVARLIATLARWVTGIEIHPAAQIGNSVFIDHGMGVVIGATAIIEDDCTLYQGVTLGGTSLNPGKRHPTLRQGAMISSAAQVLGNIEIGRYAKVGANAVVLHDVPDFQTAVGVPARVLAKNTPTNVAADLDLEMVDTSATAFVPYCPNQTHPLELYVQLYVERYVQTQLQAQALQQQASMQAFEQQLEAKFAAAFLENSEKFVEKLKQ